MTEQEYRQYINENYSPEEAHLYEDMYNEGKIWNGIKAFGKALFQPGTAQQNWFQKVGQNTRNNYTQNQLNSTSGQENILKNISKTKAAGANSESQAIQVYNSALQLLAKDIVTIQKNGIFGGNSFKQKKVAKDTAIAKQKQKDKKEGDELLKKLNSGDGTITQNFQDSKIIYRPGHFIEELQQGKLTNLLKNWGFTNITDATQVYQTLKQIDPTNLNKFIKVFYGPEGYQKAAAHGQALTKAINDLNTIKTNQANQAKMIQKYGAQKPTQAAKPEQPAEQPQVNQQNLVSAIVSALENNNNGAGGTTLQPKAKGNTAYITKCLKNALQATNNSYKISKLAEPLALELEKQEGTEPPCLNSNSHDDNVAFIQKILTNTKQLNEAKLVSQFLNKYYF